MSQHAVQTKLQKMEKELLQNIRVVEDAIGQVAVIRGKLAENSEQTKAEIHSIFGDQVETLQKRETQLIRQVDVLACHQSALLQVQYANLFHCLGSLEASLRCCELAAGTGNADHIITSVDDIESIKKLIHQKVPSFLLTANTGSLNTYLNNFGRVELSGGLMQYPIPDSSVSLPSKVEDYEDGDHHVLYKSLEELKLDKKDNEMKHVTVSFPKLSRNIDDWLCASAIRTEAPPTGLLDAKQWLQSNNATGNLQNKTSQLQQWLSQMKNQTESEPNVQELDEYLLLHSCADVCSGVTSESIEIVPLSDVSSNSPSFVMVDDPVKDVFSHTKNTPMTEWLAESYNKKIDAAGSVKSCLCQNKIDTIEIENLVAIGKCCSIVSQTIPWPNFNSEKSLWLASENRRGSLGNNSCGPVISEVCRANEICGSFSECVCDRNCGIVATEKSGRKKARVESNQKANRLKAAMKKILEGKSSDWLRFPAKLSDSNRMVGHSSLRNRMSESKEWVHQYDEGKLSEETKEKGTNEPPNSCQSLKNKIYDSFKPYMEQADSNMWIATRQKLKKESGDDCMDCSETSTETLKSSYDVSNWLVKYAKYH